MLALKSNSIDTIALKKALEGCGVEQVILISYGMKSYNATSKVEEWLSPYDSLDIDTKFFFRNGYMLDIGYTVPFKEEAVQCIHSFKNSEMIAKMQKYPTLTQLRYAYDDAADIGFTFAVNPTGLITITDGFSVPNIKVYNTIVHAAKQCKKEFWIPNIKSKSIEFLHHCSELYSIYERSDPVLLSGLRVEAKFYCFSPAEAQTEFAKLGLYHIGN